MNKLIIPFVFIVCFFTTSCVNDDEPVDRISTIMLSVESYTAEVAGSFGNYESLIVKEEGASENKKHTSIIGFDYEKGYKYQLKVERTQLANPPMDGSNIQYRLIEVISKTFDGYKIDFRYFIDADDVEDIAFDISSDSETMRDYYYIIYPGSLSFYNAKMLELIDCNGVQQFKYGIEWKQSAEIPNQFHKLLPEGQIVAAGDWILHETIEDAGVDSFFVMMERVSGGLSSRAEQPLYVRPWLYKDYTEYYNTLYPNAGVRSVIVAQVLYWRGVDYSN